MPSTNAVEIVPIAEAVTEMVLQPRRHWLKKKEPRLEYVRDTRKKIAAYVAKPVFMLLAVAFADIDDGAPIAAVLQPWYAVIDLLRSRASSREQAKGRSWKQRYDAICQRETEADCQLDKAQFRVSANADDIAALSALRLAIRDYRIVLDEKEALLNERFVTGPVAA